ncbi:MAG TPA: DUF5723 family protein [Candidatus Marinimicrobia bacterium]|nr:DUF5723 family protein [Candidatus Neomarinimicrobiota bacterium]
MKKIKYIVVGALLVIVSQGYSQLYMNPRSISFADAYATQARGGDVIGWNPANLGLNDNPKFQFNFGIIPIVPFPALQISNNTISTHLLNNHIFTGDYLDDDAKEELLSHFPDGGLNFNPLVQMRFLNFSVNSWAFTLGAEVTGKVVAPKSLFRLALFGNEFEEPIDLSDTDLDLQSVVTLGIAHGWQIDNVPYLSNYVDKFSVGIAVKLLAGAGYSGFDDLTANVTTYKDRIILEGDLKGEYGLGGAGLAIDIGAASVINEKMTANLALNNVVGFLNWGIGEAGKAEYSFYADIPSSDFGDIDSIMDESLRKDTTYTVSGIRTNYPAYMIMGFEYRVLQNLRLFVNYRQSFSNDMASTTTPAFSFAAEFLPANWLPIRLGIGVGGNDKIKWGVGSGMTFKHYRLEWGFAQTGGFFNHGKGLAFCLDQSLVF